MIETKQIVKRIERDNRRWQTAVRIALICVFIGMAFIILTLYSLVNRTNEVLKNTQTAAQAAQETTKNTNQLVKSQSDIIRAIKEQGDVQICMLRVPVEQRTTDVEGGCRKEAAKMPTATEPPSSAGTQSSPPSSSGSATATSPSSSPTPTSPSPTPLVTRILHLIGL